jgi:hypothetical protein
MPQRKLSMSIFQVQIYQIHAKDYIWFLNYAHVNEHIGTSLANPLLSQFCFQQHKTFFLNEYHQR